MTINVKTRFYLKAAEVEKNLIKKVANKAEYYKWYRYERGVFPSCDDHIACSIAERDDISKIVGKPVSLVPSGTDVSRIYPKKRDFRSKKLLFTGTLDYAPNSEAVVYFCKKIFPKIRKVLPETIFQIVGREPSADLGVTYSFNH